MWSSFSNAIPNFGRKRNLAEPSTACSEFSDDETSSITRTEDGLECQICYESFNIVENVPYVLWCGHTLCKNCLLGLNLASEISNFREKTFSSFGWSRASTVRDLLEDTINLFCHHGPLFALGNQAGNIFRRATTTPHRLGRSEPNNGGDVVRPHLTLHKSLDFFIRLTTKFPLVITLVALVLCVLPASAVVLALYLVITVLLAVPAFFGFVFCLPWFELAG